MLYFICRRGGRLTEEKALILALQRRQRRALHQIIDTYTGYVTTVACRVLGPRLRHEDLEEVVSDVFLALWQNAGTLDPSCPLRPWLAATARNKAIDRLRVAVPSLPLPADAVSDDGADPAAAVERAECQDALTRAINALGEPERTLCIRYYYQGESLRDTAEALHLNKATTKTKLRRARQQLKEFLRKEGITHA